MTASEEFATVAAMAALGLGSLPVVASAPAKLPAGSSLFTPLTVGPVTLSCRIVLPAMVTRLCGEDGHVNQDIEDRYVRFAEGGPGLIVVEAMGISQAKSGPLLRISSDEFLPGLSRLARRVHEAGPETLVVPQIIHFLKIARSGYRQTIHDLSPVEIADIIAQFAGAAVRARQAGYDGVELHMAHAYTLSSFLSRKNRRKDEYGGSLRNRLRVPLAVIERVKAAVGEDFLLGVRFDGEECITDGYSLRDAADFAVAFARAGVHYVSISAGGKFEDAVKKPGEPIYPYTGYSGDRCMPGRLYPDGYNLYLPEGIKAALVAHGFPAVRVVGTGKIWRPEHAEALVAPNESGRSRIDLVGMARQLLADPDWPKKARSGRADRIVYCEYGNVCKALDENFERVRCTLWPKDSPHAPRSHKSDAPDAYDAAPSWPDGDAGFSVQLERGKLRLSWKRVVDADLYGYELLRAEGESSAGELLHYASVRAATPAYLDAEVLPGETYTYAVCPYDKRGQRGPLSPLLRFTVPTD